MASYRYSQHTVSRNIMFSCSGAAPQSSSARRFSQGKPTTTDWGHAHVTGPRADRQRPPACEKSVLSGTIVLTHYRTTLLETCYRESRIAFEKQLRSSFGPRARESSDLTDSSASEESLCRSSEHDRQLDGMLQSQLDPRARHNPPESVPATEHLALPWYRACALRVVSHRDFEFVVMCITIVNCVGLALYGPLQPQTHPRNKWMDAIGTCFLLHVCLLYGSKSQLT